MRFHSRINLGVWFLAIAGIPALLHGQTSAPSVGAAASFAVLGGSRVTSSGSTIVTGNLGVSPGNTITGSPTVKVGATFRNDSTARQAQRDAAAAYNDLAGRMCSVDLTGQDLGGKTLGTGVYCFSSSGQLTGTLTLSAAGNPAAVWIFRVASTFTTAAESRVLAINGGQAGKVFWQVGNSASLGADSTFLGSLFALTSITLNNGASVSGRLLSRTGDVTLDTNDVSLCCDPLTVDPPTLPGGTSGTAYNQTITASGGLPPYIFTIISGALPAGLNPLTPGGVLSGTLASAGTFSFTVMATDSHGCTGSRTYNVTCPTITVGNPDVTTGLAGQPFSHMFTHTGGTGTITFSTPDTLPAGLSLNADGVLVGTPLQMGKFPMVVTFTDANGCTGTGTTYNLEIICPMITVTNPSVEVGTAGVPFSQTFTFTQSGGVGVTTFSILSGRLPAGLTLNPATGCLEGTTTQTGSFPIVVRASSSSGCTGDGPTYPLVINCQTITVTNPITTVGTVGTPFSETFSQSNAIGGATFSLDSGTLPAGLGLTLHTTGVLDGTPMQSGSFPITVKVTDGIGCSGIGVTYPLLINPAPCATLTLSTLPNGWPGVPYSEVITASGGTPPYTFVVSGTLPPGLARSPASLNWVGTPTT
ncbi:MAG TPA: ice-binding family protein, partial [Thermoanaerobaculia bacterium]